MGLWSKVGQRSKIGQRSKEYQLSRSRPQYRPIPLWPSGMFKAIGTRGREFEPRPGLAMPQKLLLE